MSRSIRYKKIANQIANLVCDKQVAYGDSFGKSGEILKLFYPNGVKPESYRDMLSMIRVIDKLMRIATDKHAFEESPWLDICGYALLAVEAETRQKS